MHRIVSYLLVLIATTQAVGCAHWGTRWGSPGTMYQQRNRAVVNDPYIDNTLGPAVDSVRPRDYSRPLAEPVKARVHRDSIFFRPF